MPQGEEFVPGGTLIVPSLLLPHFTASHKRAHRSDWTKEQIDDLKMILRMSDQRLSPAYLSSNPCSHYSLGLPAYCRATSPIRRFADMIVHHQIKAHLRQVQPPFNSETLIGILGPQEERAKIFKKLERDCVR